MRRSRDMNEAAGRKQYLAEMAILIALLATLFFSACASRELSPEEQQLKFQSAPVRMNSGSQLKMQIGTQYLSPPRSPFPYYPYAPPFSEPPEGD
jgi:hypothetical protein